MIKEIVKMGNPLLRRVSQEVSEDFVKSESFSQLLVNMRDSMKHYGGIGIAAPQIGVELRVAIIELGENNRYGEEVHFPFQIFINPEIEYLTDSLSGHWEGCLSVPGLRGYVERPDKVKVTYRDENYTKKEIIAEGFLATVLQHELDHLFGVLYVDRIKDITKLVFQKEYEDFVQGG